MSTYVTKADDGKWIGGCVDDLHPFYEVLDEEFTTKGAAERWATLHRGEDRRDREIYERRIAHCCRTCGSPL